jgi:flagellar FliL protein
MAVDEPQQLPEVTPTKKKGRSKLTIFAIVVIVLGGAGGSAWWYLRAAPTNGAAAAAESDVDMSKRGLLAFEPFLVNLADPGGGRFLKATIQVVLPEPDAAEHFKEKPVLVMQARSAILELLTEQTADVLVTPDGKKALKEQIKAKVSVALGNMKVIDVLFSDFVVQF